MLGGQEPASTLSLARGKGGSKGLPLGQGFLATAAVVVRSLERGGFRVLQASDPAVALQVADLEGRPDLILTDLMMPGIHPGAGVRAGPAVARRRTIPPL